MDKDQKKIKYQELFLSELRNSKFGEKRIEDALREMETKSNMERLTKALKNIWKKSDENVKELGTAFPVAQLKTAPSEVPTEEEREIKVNLDSRKRKSEDSNMEKRRQDISDLKNLKVLSYDHLVELVDDLNIEEVTEILTSVAGEEKNNHQYLTRLAEKLLKGRDSKKVPDSKP